MEKMTTLCFILLLLSPVILIENDTISVQKVLSIGQNEGDDNYIFGRVSDVALDEWGNIYILDSLRSRVQMFSNGGEYISTIGKPKFSFKSHEEFKKNRKYMMDEMRKGVEPEELYFPRQFYYKNGKLYILCTSKVCIYSIENKFVQAIDLRRKIIPRSIYVNAGNEIIIMGAKYDSDRMFHVFDEGLTYSHSFGEYFEIPTEMNSSIPQNMDELNRKRIALPSQCYYFNEYDELVFLNPFKYEIKIYQGEDLINSIIHSKKGYKGLAGISSGYIDGRPAGGIISYIATPSVIKKSKHLFIFHFDSNSDIQKQYSVDVFSNGVYQNSYGINIGGLPLITDRRGFIYCHENADGGNTIGKYAFKFSEN